MDKVRIYELAKELNVSSKRLMEKLGEININVKNHMSYLEENELSALYKHIGINTQKEAAKPAAQPMHAKSEAKRDTKSAPRIIRTTEIIVDSDNNSTTNVVQGNNESKADPKAGSAVKKQPVKQDYVKVTSSGSGLMSGMVRDEGLDKRKHSKKADDMVRAEEADVKDKAEKAEAIVRDDNTVSKKGNSELKANNVNNMNIGNTTVAVANDAKSVDDKINKEEKSDAIKSPESKEEGVSREAKHHEEPDIKTGETRTYSDRPQNRPQGDRPYGNRPQGDRPQGDRPYNNRPQGDRPYNNRPQGDRPYNNRPQGDRPYGDRPQGDRPYGDRPQGDRPYGNRPQGDRPYGDRPQGDRPYGDRPQGDRPYGNRPQGDRPYGNRPQGDRPYGDRPQGDRPYGNRPQGDRPYGDRPQGDRPYGNRPQGDRPYGNRPQGDRPYGNRPQGDRPYGDRQQGDRPYGNRPQGDRPYGNRPQGDRPYGDRPQGDRPYGNRQQGDRPYGNRPQGDRQQGGFNQRQRAVDMPKLEMTEAQKDELNSIRSEMRREFQNKDSDKDVKREQKKEVQKNAVPSNKDKFNPKKVMFNDKKGVHEVLSDDFALEEIFDDTGVKKTNKKPKKREDRKQVVEQQKHIPKLAVLTHITIGESLTVKELAESLKKTTTEIIKKLMGLGIMATINQEVDFDTAAIISDEFGIKAEKAVQVNEEDILFDDEDEENDEGLEPRPPVVVVMGHVDHGKTSLLDAIREAHVTEGEAGGITQHIGAYKVKINDRYITFLDTPGHEAFTAMRARGAQVTDIAILVVAADDGVMPQTIEAINHAKAANVSIIVAINKIDKPGANPDKVKQELTEYGIVAEEWGGDAIMVPVSAKKRENIDGLLEMVLLAADILELKANPNKQAKGTIIEAKLDKARGPVATVLVQRGTLNTGDSIVTGTSVGRIRAMTDEKGQQVKSAGPSTPVEILGLHEVPEAGEIFYAITDEKVAKQLAEKRKLKIREQQMKASSKITLEDLYTQIKEGKVKDLNIIVKADVQGSVEAVKQSLEKLSNEEVRVKTIHGAVGAITESDVTLAQVSNAIIIGFNVRPGSNVAEMAQNVGVDLRLYSIIYNAIEDIEAAMKGMLEPTYKEAILGHVEIRQLFKVSGVGTIAGGYVLDGKIVRNSEVRVVREGIVVFTGKLASLKRFKDDAKEVAQGYECGFSIEKFNEIKEGDIVESFIMEEVKR
jgi:translation initiation factor IF-2